MVEYSFLTTGGAEPRSFKEAMKGDDSAKWKEAAEVEYKAIMDNHTWELVPLPAGRKAVGSRWVFKIKENADGSIERYKARLVAQGFSQKPHLDYTETFAPVAKFASLRAILALAAIEDMELDHMDVSSAFLNGDLDEEIYMSQPEGFIPKGQESLVCRLKKPLYGLKQSPRQWYRKLNELFVELGFKRIQSDHSLFVWAKDSIKIIIPVYVDDLTIASNHSPTRALIKEQLRKRFRMRDLGSLSYLIGIEVLRDRPNCKMYLSQRKHLKDILERFHQSNSRPVSTPLDPDIHLSKDMSPQTPEEVEYMKRVPYLSAVGSLMYLAVGTRPDIAYAVGVLSRFNSCAGPQHWKAVQCVFQYLRGTSDFALEYGPSSSAPLLRGYSDVDHGGDQDTGRSTNGYAFFLGAGCISWSSKRQTVVAKSTTEAEYIASNHAGAEAIWLRHFLEELGFPPKGATTILADNQSAIAVAKNPEHHGRMKQLLLSYHWIRDQVETGTLQLEYVPTGEMTADIMTKALGCLKHEHCCAKFGLIQLEVK